MTINEAMKKYRLPNPTTTEDLEMRFSGMDGKVLNFWRQGSPRRILLQWTEQALLLWRGIRVPDR